MFALKKIIIEEKELYSCGKNNLEKLEHNNDFF